MGGGVGPITPDTVASVGDSLAGMSLHHIAAALPQAQVVDDGLDRNPHLTSPVAPAGELEWVSLYSFCTCLFSFLVCDKCHCIASSKAANDLQTCPAVRQDCAARIKCVEDSTPGCCCGNGLGVWCAIVNGLQCCVLSLLLQLVN
jgi:hypothetical protein